MRKLIMAVTLLLPILVAQGQVAGVGSERKNYEFANGRWFDGQKFVLKKFYSAGGTLTSRRPARVDSAIDLSGKYVIPPFGEAHNHNVAQSSRLDAIIRMYLEAGIFYVKNPNSFPRSTTPLVGKINTPRSVDVVFANGGLTASGGHPVGLAERNIARGSWDKADGEGAFSHAQLQRSSPARQTWEYIIVQESDGAPGAKQLNNLGTQGWELVSVVCTEASISPINLQIGGGGGGGGTDHCYYYMKRSR